MFNEYDVVALKKGLPNAAIPVSGHGTVVMVLSTKDQAYEIEFFDENHNITTSAPLSAMNTWN